MVGKFLWVCNKHDLHQNALQGQQGVEAFGGEISAEVVLRLGRKYQNEISAPGTERLYLSPKITKEPLLHGGSPQYFGEQTLVLLQQAPKVNGILGLQHGPAQGVHFFNGLVVVAPLLQKGFDFGGGGLFFFEPQQVELVDEGRGKIDQGNFRGVLTATLVKEGLLVLGTGRVVAGAAEGGPKQGMGVDV